jgi:hypothetical protein
MGRGAPYYGNGIACELNFEDNSQGRQVRMKDKFTIKDLNFWYGDKHAEGITFR